MNKRKNNRKVKTSKRTNIQKIRNTSYNKEEFLSRKKPNANIKNKKAQGKKVSGVNKVKIHKKNRVPLFARGKLDLVFIFLVILLAAIGLLTLLSASSAKSLSEYGTQDRFFLQQIKATGIGIFIAVFLASIDYRNYKNRFVETIALIFVFASIILVYRFGVEVNGAKRWLQIGGMTVQLSEPMKIALIIFLANYLTRKVQTGEIREFFKGSVSTLILIGLPVLSVYVFQKHMSTAAVLGLIGMVMAVVAGINIFHVIILGVASFALAFSVAGDKIKDFFSFRGERIKVHKDPWQDPSGYGWQIIQSYYAISSGGLTGLGVGNSRQKRLFLPEPQNDFIFSIFVEELGYLGGIALIALFMFFIIKIFNISKSAPDLFGKLIGVGITVFFTLQIWVNIAVATGVVPVTGMALPFFSAGGSALIVVYAAVGLMISISRVTSSIEKEKEQEQE